LKAFNVKIIIAKHAGYCYGVQRALKLAREATELSPTPIYTLGPIIHNPQVVESLEQQGVRAVATVDEIEKGTIIVRTHGVDPKIIEKAREKGFEVIDATCPFVAKAQQRAARFIKGGYRLVIVGERNHPEVVGLLAHAGNNAVVIETAKEIDNIESAKRMGVVVQTTQSLENLQSIVCGLVGKAKEIKVFNTICNATSQRQESAREVSEDVDLMLVVGGKNSANTTRLAQICKENNPNTYHIETAVEINDAWLKEIERVGITAGASTPDWILSEVVEKLQAYIGG
jgi:4-hydroxy-3-methylbut-2-enyl diphosphate reductase